MIRQAAALLRLVLPSLEACETIERVGDCMGWPPLAASSLPSKAIGLPWRLTPTSVAQFPFKPRISFRGCTSCWAEADRDDLWRRHAPQISGDAACSLVGRPLTRPLFGTAGVLGFNPKPKRRITPTMDAVSQKGQEVHAACLTCTQAAGCARCTLFHMPWQRLQLCMVHAVLCQLFPLPDLGGRDSVGNSSRYDAWTPKVECPL